MGISEAMVATLDLILVTASLPFYLYGAWIVLREETVTWRILLHHLAYIGVGLTLTTVPVIVWMVPRLLPLDPFVALHAFLGLQAYALLLFGLTGIGRIFMVKRRHDLYHEPDPDIDLDDLHEHMGAWRFRLRIGVFGYLLFWILAWIVGAFRYALVVVPAL